MSAVMIDELVSPQAPARWPHVARPSVRRANLVPVQPAPPLVRTRPVVTPAATAQPEPVLTLTPRGIAVVLALMVTLCLTAAVVVVSAFLRVSNDPVVGDVGAGVPVAAAQG